MANFLLQKNPGKAYKIYRMILAVLLLLAVALLVFFLTKDSGEKNYEKGVELVREQVVEGAEVCVSGSEQLQSES